jgi:hypothetical protein
MSDTIKANGSGRLGNLLFHNFVVSCFAKNYKKAATYQWEDKFTRLGILFHKEQRPVASPTTIELSDSNLLQYIDNPTHESTHFKIKNDTYCQLKEISHLLYAHIRLPSIRDSIVAANPYSTRYRTNRDVFVHVRLGDVPQYCPDIAYFETALTSLAPYEKGYISTDSPHHPLVKTLSAKYALQPLFVSELETLQFGSTCAHLVLSNGTFSWMLGALAVDAVSVQYPSIKHKWHGDIFVIPEWKEIAW